MSNERQVSLAGTASRRRHHDDHQEIQRTQDAQDAQDAQVAIPQNAVNVSGGNFQGSQMGGVRSNYEYYGPVTFQQGQTSTGGNELRKSKPRMEDDTVPLSDSIRMNKNKRVKPFSPIFYGEQVSEATGTRQIAIKLLDWSDRNIQEARHLLKLVEHQNVVSIIHSDKYEQQATTHIYIAMELCHQQNLHEYITKSKTNNDPFDPKLSISQAKQIVSGLGFIHENDIIHRDLKPHNVLFSRDKKFLKIADFGLSKPMTRGRSVTKVTNPGAGTDGYRAPETYNRDELSKSADVYSLGLTCYFLWSRGKHPFGEDPDDWNSNIKKNVYRDLSQLTLLPNAEKAKAVIEAMLRFEPKYRPKTGDILEHDTFTTDVHRQSRPIERPDLEDEIERISSNLDQQSQREPSGSTSATPYQAAKATRPKSVRSQITSVERPSLSEHDRSLRLPARVENFDKTLSNFVFSTKEYKSLCSCFDLVMIRDSTDKISDDVINQKGREFLMGGVIDFDVIASSKFCIERDVMKGAKEYIQKNFLREGKSGIVPIYHPPGTGGTTLARMLLWELRYDAICIMLKEREHELKSVEESIKLLHGKTKMPVVLVIDGRSTPNAETILNSCRYEHLVILHSQRRFQEPECSESNPRAVRLSKEMTEGERRLFKIKFPELAKKLESRLKYMIICEAYVTDALSHVHDSPDIWKHVQRVLAESPPAINTLLTYLYLAYYYGHCGIPRVLLTPLLHGEDNLDKYGNLILEDQFGALRLCHYRMARCIRTWKVEKDEIPLGKKICNIVIDFIQLIKSLGSEVDKTDLPVSIDELLSRIFIEKDYQHCMDFEGNCMSYLLEETGSREDQKLILEELVKCCPGNGEFHAHLGRLHALRGDFIQASQSFEKARNSGANNDNAVLHRILNMNGNFVRFQIKFDITSSEDGNSKIAIPEILESAYHAIQYFQQVQKTSRHCRILGCSYLGEINVRLDIIGLATRRSNSADSHREALSIFALKSFILCDLLLQHCLENAQKLEISSVDINKCVSEFRSAYDKQRINNSTGEKDVIQSDKYRLFMLRREHMLTYESPKFCIYDVKCLDHLKEYRKLCTNIVTNIDAHHWNLQSSMYMVEWLQAIRTVGASHVSTLENVARTFEKWHEADPLSTFYRYIIVTVQAINEEMDYRAYMAHWRKSNNLRKKLRDTFIPYCQMENPIEWLVNCKDPNSFSNVVHNYVIDKSMTTKRRMCRGIRVCNGRIKLYGKGNFPKTVQKVEAYFNPQQYSGSIRGRDLVEFYLGFNPKYGLQAYEIHPFTLLTL